MLLRWFSLTVILLLGVAGCRDTEAVTDQVYNLVERCWEFVDTGEFPSRGLFWVSDTSPIATYDDAGAQLRIEYTAFNTENLFCGFSNHGTVWIEADRDAVFDAMKASVPDWIAVRTSISPEDVDVLEMSNDAFSRHIVFQNKGSDVSFAVHEDRDDGTVGILIAKGLFANWGKERP